MRPDPFAMFVNNALRDDGRIKGLAKDFASTSNRVVVVDNFLTPTALPPIRRMLLEKGEVREHFKLKRDAEAFDDRDSADARSPVSSDLFWHSPEEDRFIHQEVFAGAPEADQRVHNYVCAALSSRAMLDWLAKVTGEELASIQNINLKRHGPGNFLRKHSDAAEGRKICGVLYVHEGWREEFGGEFLLHQHDGSVRHFEPRDNRLILFDTQVKNDHEIAPLGKTPDGWMRLNYSIWYS